MWWLWTFLGGANPEPIGYSSQGVALNFALPNLEHMIHCGRKLLPFISIGLPVQWGREHCREHSHILHLLRQQEPLGYIPGGSTLYLLPPFS